MTEDQVQQAGQVVPEMITGIGPATFAARSLARGVEMPDPSVVSMSGVGPRAGVGPARPSDSAAEALGFKDTVYHSSLSPEEFTQFDLDRGVSGGAKRSFQDYLGAHVGTAEAASDRNRDASEKATGRFDNRQGFTMELRARTDNPLTKEKFAEMLRVPVERLFHNVEGPITERDFSSMMQSYGAHLDGRSANYKYTPEGVATLLRRDLADKGFTHIPYVNAVEDKGSTSFIMLTDRGGRSPAVLRDVRAGFDPSKVNDPDLRFSDGGAVDPDDFYSLMNSVDVFALR